MPEQRESGGAVGRETFRVKSVSTGANAKATTWVRAPCRRAAEQRVRETLNRHMVESCRQMTPPAHADVIEVAA